MKHILTDECPFGGDVVNDCEGCDSSVEYHYNGLGECVQRLQPKVKKCFMFR
jgi:hypothetical protein